jgi:hypothetical protein
LISHVGQALGCRRWACAAQLGRLL